MLLIPKSRPIKLASVIFKIFEAAITHKLRPFLETGSLRNNPSADFARAGLRVSDNCHLISWLAAVDNGREAHLVSLDISKTFYQGQHNLEKEYGARGCRD